MTAACREWELRVGSKYWERNNMNQLQRASSHNYLIFCAKNENLLHVDI